MYSKILRVIVLVAVCCGSFFSGMAKTDVDQFNEYKRLAEKGNARAQCNLGYCYDVGKGVSQNYGKAVEWYTKAANQGHAVAQYNLGLCYEYGEGVAKDILVAVEWYTKSAEQGYEEAQKALVEIGPEVEKAKK